MKKLPTTSRATSQFASQIYSTENAETIIAHAGALGIHASFAVLSALATAYVATAIKPTIRGYLDHVRAFYQNAGDALAKTLPVNNAGESFIRTNFDFPPITTLLDSDSDVTPETPTAANFGGTTRKRGSRKHSDISVKPNPSDNRTPNPFADSDN